MAVGPGYDGSKVEPVIRDGWIRVTDEWLQSHAQKTPENEIYLRTELIGQSICPRMWMFNDTPEVRRVLQLEQNNGNQNQKET